MDINKVSIGKNPPQQINVIIEVPLGSDPIKYEMDKYSGALYVDRFLYTAMHYPCNYGFIPTTLSDDGDPIDVMVYGNRPLAVGCIVAARPIGVLIMKDEAGLDEKILAVPDRHLSKFYDDVEEYSDMPSILLDRIAHFFEEYKALEPNKWVEVVGWKGVAEACEIIERGIKNERRKTVRS